MNRFKCPACGRNQYTSADTAEGCIYCGHQKLEKMDKLEPEEREEEICNLTSINN
jgi:DNA-directed RNA polymerase subunit RPC12/RpoP